MTSPLGLTPEQAALAASIRTCLLCTSTWLCWLHQYELDRRFPERCADPTCYACKENR